MCLGIDPGLLHFVIRINDLDENIYGLSKCSNVADIVAGEDGYSSSLNTNSVNTNSLNTNI